MHVEHDHSAGAHKHSLVLAAHAFVVVRVSFSSPDMLCRVGAFIREACKSRALPEDGASDPCEEPAVEEEDVLVGEDYERMGVGRDSPWRLTAINEKYAICPTYGRSFAVPRGISDSVLRHASRFRARHRLAILSYAARGGGAPICRASQAMVGLQRARSIQDERMIEHIRGAAPSRRLLIVDARPQNSAMANAVTGAGIMPLGHYEGCDRVYLDIDNIHAVTAAYSALYENLLVPAAAGRGSDEAALLAGSDGETSFGDSQWATLYQTIMEGVSQIVDAVAERGVSALVHCSDGWDRTAQLVSLAQIAIDPFYRTTSGLARLIQREWLSAGHQFETRLGRPIPINGLGRTVLAGSSRSALASAPATAGDGSSGATSVHPVKRLLDSLTWAPAQAHGSMRTASPIDGGAGALVEDNRQLTDNFSPIFPQFLDCLYQMVLAEGSLFEYGQATLEAILLEAHRPLHRTFWGNCESDRRALRLAKGMRRGSFWDSAAFVESASSEQPDPKVRSGAICSTSGSGGKAAASSSGASPEGREEASDRSRHVLLRSNRDIPPYRRPLTLSIVRCLGRE